MKNILVAFSFLFCLVQANSQELFPYSEPASNMPARSVSLKTTSIIHGDIHSSRTLHRHMPEMMFGISKKLMFHAGLMISNMHQPKMILEGARVYFKYRFLSNDGVHKHFRMAAFAAGAHSANHLDHNEINLMMGEQTGVQAGLIATQLWNKFALSATASWNEVLSPERWEKTVTSRYAFQSINYSISAGYLVLPVEYKSYEQTNINLYAELLGSRNLNFRNETYYVDLAPSIQAIFKSTAKLNLGYRFQLNSDIYRLTKNSWLISFEYLFLHQNKD
jgi:hypothetical protein